MKQEKNSKSEYKKLSVYFKQMKDKIVAQTNEFSNENKPFHFVSVLKFVSLLENKTMLVQLIKIINELIVAQKCRWMFVLVCVPLMLPKLFEWKF